MKETLHDSSFTGSASAVRVSLAAIWEKWQKLLIVSAFFGMAMVTRGVWPDALTDFGNDLFAAWRISEGASLGTDIAWFVSGPLPPYVIGGLFSVVGPSIHAVFLLNALILFGIIVLLYRIYVHLTNGSTSTLLCVIFILVFSFSMYGRTSNYNYIAPYTHAITYGIFFALLSIEFLRHYSVRRSLRSLAVAGVALGLTFLCKPEIFLATALTLGTGVAVLPLPGSNLGPRRGTLAAALLASTSVPPAAGALLLSLRMPVREAIHVVLGAWPYVLDAQMRAMPFYREMMGTSDVAGNLVGIAKWSLGWAVLFTPVILAGMPRIKPRLRLLALGWPLLVAALSFLFWRRVAWDEIARPLTMTSIGITATALFACVRSPREDKEWFWLVMGLFSSLLLLKMVLRARVWHYGFVLAMPATLTFAAALLDYVPRRLRASGGSGAPLYATTLVVLGAFSWVHVLITLLHVEGRTVQVSGGFDAFYADTRAFSVDEVVKVLRRVTKEDETVAVFPEGVMINYLSRRNTAVPFENFLPTDMIAFGEDAITESLRRNPPDYVVLVRRNLAEYGSSGFGIGYAKGIWKWIVGSYALTNVIPVSPNDPAGHMFVLKRTGQPSGAGSLSARRVRPPAG